jgi:hypothetical protein
MMSEAEYEGLKEDIRLHGQNDDVLIWDGQLLDGRNRLRACLELGIKPGWAELPKTLDPVAWVLSHNLHRRHLTTAQRAMVATNLATLLSGRPEKTTSGIPLVNYSQADAAEKLHVSVDSVKKARKVRAKATKKVIAAVESGTMSLNAAVKTTNPDRLKKKNGTEKLSAAKLVDALTKQHIGHIARGLTNIAKANRGEGVQFKAADAGLNQMIIALKKMREGET